LVISWEKYTDLMKRMALTNRRSPSKAAGAMQKRI
jgi:hypothetical protein